MWTRRGGTRTAPQAGSGPLTLLLLSNTGPISVSCRCNWQPHSTAMLDLSSLTFWRNLVATQLRPKLTGPKRIDHIRPFGFPVLLTLFRGSPVFSRSEVSFIWVSLLRLPFFGWFKGEPKEHHNFEGPPILPQAHYFPR